jgi:hypothetical protein
MERLRVAGREIPFEPALVPSDDGDGYAASEVLFLRDHNDRSTARLEISRSGDGVEATDLVFAFEVAREFGMAANWAGKAPGISSASINPPQATAWWRHCRFWKS